jgi:hypothetical protein
MEDDDSTPLAKPPLGGDSQVSALWGTTFFSAGTFLTLVFESIVVLPVWQDLFNNLCGSTRRLFFGASRRQHVRQLKTRVNDDGMHTLNFMCPWNQNETTHRNPASRGNCWPVLPSGGSSWMAPSGVQETTPWPLSGNCWTTLISTLQHALQDVPPHVREGLLIATSHCLSSWKFTSQRGALSIPRVQHVPYTYGVMRRGTTFFLWSPPMSCKRIP